MVHFRLIQISLERRLDLNHNFQYVLTKLIYVSFIDMYCELSDYNCYNCITFHITRYLIIKLYI
jgi:hypothetical protein